MRRRMLHLAPLVLLAGLGLVGCSSSHDTGSKPPPAQSFVSRPDLRPPVFHVYVSHAPADEGLVFLGVKQEVPDPAPMIVDPHGQLVWMDPKAGAVDDVRVQQYHGQPVITYWTGKSSEGHGQGHYVILDSSYHQIAQVQAGNGLRGDLHEFTLTPRGTALITAYREVRADLSSVGGPKNGYVLDGVAQEVDVATGKVLFQWSAADHIRPSESYASFKKSGDGSKDDPYDYFHINSVDSDGAGHLLICARNTHAIYQISAATGAVEWRLGGKRSDFTMGPGTTFAWQHDARYRAGNRISLYDDEEKGEPEQYARGLVLDVDTAAMTVSVDSQYLSPDRLIVRSQGNTQILPSGNVLVGWGSQPYFTEFSPDGDVLLNASFGGDGATSYRVYRSPWVGRPTTQPDVAARPGDSGQMTMYASWNGATEVASWEFLVGNASGALQVVNTVPRTGFETAANVPPGRYVQARALDAAGHVLGTSKVVRVGAGG